MANSGGLRRQVKRLRKQMKLTLQEGMTMECENCGGTGYLGGAHEEMCDWCDGFGFVDVD